jgi:RecJ-like exonuclease
MRILFKTSLTFALLGILLLLIYSENITIEIKNISNITNKDMDKYVKVTGLVTRTTDTPGLFILNIKDKTSQIKVIIFKEEKINIKQDDFLIIEGKVTEYKGELEIQAEKIIKR